MKGPVLKKFRTPLHYYIYDRGSNYIAEITEEMYQSDFYNRNEDDLSDESKTILNNLKELGLFSDNILSDIEHPETDFLPMLLERSLTSIILQVTQQCNLRCEYCVYSGGYETRTHSSSKMTFETAKKSIDFLISHSVDSPEISVSFYGGEPLLEYDLVKKCIDYTNEQAVGKKVNYSMTTNATLLSDDKITFLEKNNVILTISLDGDEETQNKNRKFAGSGQGSYDVIIQVLERMHNHFPDYYQKVMFNIVVDPDNNFEQINHFFLTHPMVKDNIIRSSVINRNYSKVKTEKNEQFYIARQYEQFKLYLSQLNQLEHYSPSKLLLPEFNSVSDRIANREVAALLTTKAHHGGPCVPAVQKLFIDVDGSFYPCEKVSESSAVMKIGSITDGFDLQKIKDILNIGTLTKNHCKDCWAFRLCSLCAALADDIDNLNTDKKLIQCHNVKDAIAFQFRTYAMLREFNYDFSTN